MGFAKGELVLEVGYGPDCDDELRAEIKGIVGTEFLEGATTDVVDAVLLWFREDDGDLVDELMDAIQDVLEGLANGLTNKFLHGPLHGLAHLQGNDRQVLIDLLPELFRLNQSDSPEKK